ncbi:MAG: PIG-L family deacetylase [Oscillospiraceae bacterium]|nr:PIG-L family deacetylase [Oscillospiraceae bacterium]
MNILFAVAHPDDEVLGAGGTIPRLIREGHHIAVCTLVNLADARANRSATLAEDQKNAHAILGIEKAYNGDFPNIRMNTVPHLELVQFIEKAIEDWQAEVIYTHHPADTNIDHEMTSGAAQAAARLFQRRSGIPPLRQLSFMEIPSSTEWALNSAMNRFTPNCFADIGEDGMKTKLRALAAYIGVMRPQPHPRSEEALRGLAAWRGAQAGCAFAEAFETVFQRM